MFIAGSKKSKGNIIKTLLALIISTLGSIAMENIGVGKESIIMVFLLGVLFTTVFTSSYLWGIFSSIAGFMLFNFLFTEPRFTFVVYNSNDIILLTFFLITAIVSGKITSRLQKQIEISERNESTSTILYKIAAGFLPLSGKKSIIMRGISYIKEYTDLEAIVQIDGDSEKFSKIENKVLDSTKKFIIKSSAGRLGEIIIVDSNSCIDNQNELIIQSIATQLGIAIDREQLYSEREEILVAMERETLRATLLRSVSHDLRSPLTALSGAGNLLADNYENLTDVERKKLAMDISEEIVWLTNLVENILNMTRINDSQLMLTKQEEVIDDVVSEAVSHTKRLMKDREFKVALPEEVITVPMDGKLIVQVLVNLLENAVRHTHADSKISLSVISKKKIVEFIIADNGEGIDKSIENKLFEKFVTLDIGVIDGKRGIGLGLSICKAIVEAHGGNIYAEPNTPIGTRFVFTLPTEVLL